MKKAEILFVEDHDGFRITTLMALRAHGFACESAEDGLRGADKLFNGQFDVLLTDLAMPKLNGHALCVQALRMRDRPAIIVLTGVVEERISADLRRRGVDCILEKPVGFPALVHAIEEALKRRTAGAAETFPTTAGGTRTEAPVESPARKDSGSAGEEPAGDEPAGNRSDKRPPADSDAAEVAILMADRAKAAKMSDAFAERGLSAACLEGADDLYHCLEVTDPDLVILEERLDGFLSGSAIAQRLVERFLGPKIILLEPADQRTATGDGDAVDGSLSEVWRLCGDTPVERIAARAAAFLRNSQGGYATISPAARSVAASSPTAPSSPDLLRLLAQHLQKSAEEIDADQVAADISSDPPAATELLRLVNSAHVGLRRRVNRISEAVKLLGPSRSVSLTYAVCQKKLTAGLDAPWAEELHRWYHRRSLLIGCGARELLRRSHPQSAEDAFALGLLQELGIVLIAGARGERYAQTVLSGVRSGRTTELTALERHAVKVDHAAVSAAALERWGFPRAVVQLVLCHHDNEIAGPSTAAENRLHAAMRVGEALADLLDDRGAARRGHFTQLLKASGLAPDVHPRDLLADTAAAAEEFLSILSLPSPKDDAVGETLQELSRDGGDANAAVAGGRNAKSAAEDPALHSPLREGIRKLVGI